VFVLVVLFLQSGSAKANSLYQAHFEAALPAQTSANSVYDDK
jgi:hypothetical protein